MKHGTMFHDGIRCGFYRHYKGGLYLVEGFSTNTETNEVMVHYVEVDEKTRIPGKAWSRPALNWHDIIVHHHGRTVRRFEPYKPEVTIEELRGILSCADSHVCVDCVSELPPDLLEPPCDGCQNNTQENSRVVLSFIRGETR